MSESRREFMQLAAVAALADQVIAQTTSASATGVPQRVLGRTGEKVSMMCLGGWHIGATKDDAEAIRIMHAAIDEGLTFFDNAWDYHDGHSEELMGCSFNKCFYSFKNKFNLFIYYNHFKIITTFNKISFFFSF